MNGHPRTELILDGSMGEGGGQILRTALSLSLCLQRPFRIRNIRSRRRNPGLRRQHLAAVEAARAVCRAEVEGAVLGSQDLRFVPHGIEAGDYRFDIGTSGSTTLVLQTLLPALVTANGHFRIEISGGTHNPLAPTFDFLDLVFLPILGRMGARAELDLLRYGFHPAGGGLVRLHVDPTSRLRPVHLWERGDLLEEYAIILLSQLPGHIAQREAAVIGARLGLREEQIRSVYVTDSDGPGNVVMAVVKSEHVTELFSSFGQRGIRAERVAEKAAQETQEYLKAGVPVGIHLADQLLLPMALAGGGSYVTHPPSRHTLTNIEVVKQFMAVTITCRQCGDKRWAIEIG